MFQKSFVTNCIRVYSKRVRSGYIFSVAVEISLSLLRTCCVFIPNFSKRGHLYVYVPENHFHCARSGIKKCIKVSISLKPTDYSHFSKIF